MWGFAGFGQNVLGGNQASLEMMKLAVNNCFVGASLMGMAIGMITLVHKN
jgi:hypothetical protein